MKKGFTLIELLGVVVLLGVIALITIPIVDTAVKKSKQKAYEVTKDTVVSAAKNWLTDNKSLIEDGSTLVLTISDLKEEGYLEFDIKNPSTGNCLDNTTSISIARTAKKYTYSIVDGELLDGTDDDCELISESPSIYLLGENPLNVEINTTFTDPGAKATDVDGNDISSEIITTGTVDTSVAANNINYKYSILSNGVSKTVTRKINVIDKKAPVLTVPGNTTIDDSITSYDLMNGVSATDNSGATVNVTTKGKITFGETGTYTITYIATDSSGNTTTKSRKITVIANCFSFDATTGTITGYTWNDTSRCPMDLVIPDSIKGVAVKYISGNAFDGTNKANKLTSVDLSSASNLIQINDGGFSSEYGPFRDNLISSVNFGTNSKITYIGYRAFQKNVISQLSIPNSVTYVGWESFEENNITSLTLGNSIRSIDNFAFRDNLLNVNSLVFPVSIQSIGSQILLNNTIKTIDLSLNINLNYISTSAFDRANIDTVVLPNIAIDIKGFEYNNLTSIVIPSNILSIGPTAFAGNKLTNVTFAANSNLNRISSSAFSGNKLTSVDLSPLTNLKTLSGYYNFSNRTTVNCNSWNSLTGCTGAFENNLLTSVVLPNGLTEIGDRAFTNNKLTSITIPSTVTTFRNYVLAENSLTTFPVASTVTTRGDGIINKNLIADSTAFMYDTAGTKLISYGGSNKVVTVPTSATYISDIAFYNCGITSVTLNNTLQTIGTYAFYNNAITSIAIPNSVVSIGSGALPYSVTAISIDKASGSITGSPWGATSATVTWLR